jgi:RNA polymerase sigma-70 factor (TIGR02957 family)
VPDACDDRSGALESFRARRPRLFGIAYRMLGSATDAEDLLQDAWLRWQGVDHAVVVDPTAFLVRLVTNLCLNELDSARARREVYVGSWLPEPVLTGGGSDLGPLDDAVQRETVSFALLTMLERLSPAERAAYVLREAFAYSSREVGDLLGTSEGNARQLHSRARRHLGVDRAAPVNPARWEELVASFFAAARDGDVARLEALLAHDVEARADGGGHVTAARRPVQGRDKVARYILGVLQRFAEGVTPALMEVNGEAALVATAAGGLRAIWFFETDGDVITGLKMVVNPAKLEFAARQLSRIGATSGP